MLDSAVGLESIGLESVAIEAGVKMESIAAGERLGVEGRSYSGRQIGYQRKEADMCSYLSAICVCLYTAMKFGGQQRNSRVRKKLSSLLV